jgi:hypothetical protein
MSFWGDLKKGNETEIKISLLYEKEGYTRLEKRDDGKYDLLLKKDAIIRSFEVKTDFYVRPDKDSGNIFVEYEYKNRPSGISTTEADWWINYFHNLKEIWYIKTDDLKDLIEEYTFLTTYQSGDDGSNTRGYLIPRNETEIKKYFKVKKIDLSSIYK